jgi:hypothetical protein
MGAVRKADRNIIGKPEVKMYCKRHRNSQKDDIQIHLRGITFEVVDWSHVFQDRVQWRAVLNTEMNLRIPLRARSFFAS